MRLHSNLKAIMDAKGLSIRQVSRDIDYRFESVRQLYNNESKQYPGELIAKLCEYLDIKVDDLLILKED